MAFRGVVIDTAVVKEPEQVIERGAVLIAKCSVVVSVAFLFFPLLRFLRSLSSAEIDWCLFLVRSDIGNSLNRSSQITSTEGNIWCSFRPLVTASMALLMMVLCCFYKYLIRWSNIFLVCAFSFPCAYLCVCMSWLFFFGNPTIFHVTLILFYLFLFIKLSCSSPNWLLSNVNSAVHHVFLQNRIFHTSINFHHSGNFSTTLQKWLL